MGNDAGAKGIRAWCLPGSRRGYTPIIDSMIGEKTMHTLPLDAFGALETAILNVLWAHAGPMTVREMHDALCERGLAYTTILTTMVRMVEKGWLSRTTQRAVPRRGRGHTDRYTVVITKGALLAATIEESCARLSADRGDRAEALAVLLGAAQ